MRCPNCKQEDLVASAEGSTQYERYPIKLHCCHCGFINSTDNNVV